MAEPAEPQAKLAPPCSDMPAFAEGGLGHATPNKMRIA
jgi:hypothetical protein